MPKGRQVWDYSRHINKKLMSFPALPFPFTSADDYVLLLTCCTPFPFGDTLAPEYPVHVIFPGCVQRNWGCSIIYNILLQQLAVAKWWGFCSSSALMPGFLVSTPVCQTLPIASLHRWNYQNLLLSKIIKTNFLLDRFLPFSWATSASTGTL